MLEKQFEVFNITVAALFGIKAETGVFLDRFLCDISGAAFVARELVLFGDEHVAHAVLHQCDRTREPCRPGADYYDVIVCRHFFLLLR